MRNVSRSRRSRCAKRGRERRVLRHRRPKPRHQFVAHGWIVDAQYAAIAHDRSAGDDEFMDVACGGACEQKIARIEIVAQAIVVDARSSRAAACRPAAPAASGAALLRVQHGAAAVLERHRKDIRAAHIDAKAGAAMQQMREPHFPQTVVVLVERKPVEAKRNAAAAPHHLGHRRDA